MSFNGFLNTFYNFSNLVFNKLKRVYQSSGFYEKKISKTSVNIFEYKPSPHILASIIKYQKKKFKVEDFEIESIWQNKVNSKEYKKLNNFFWFFSLDLKSSKKTTQRIITNWIYNNSKYNDKTWEFDMTAKRIISWLSNHQLTYENSDSEYKSMFDHMIQKQTNHLLIEIKSSKDIENKIIGCAAIILVGLAYKIKKNYLEVGLNILKNNIKSLLDNQGCLKSRNIKQLVFYLKYLILIREWFNESQINVPDHINETIYHLGQGYNLLWQSNNSDLLFNGNNISDNNELDNYLKRFGYIFKNENKEFGGYIILSSKKICLAMDVGHTPSLKYTEDYQSGALSFEIFSNGEKLIGNCGYYKKNNKRLNQLSKSSATHSTLIIDDSSSCKFFEKKDKWFVKKGLKIIKKNSVFEKNYWKINAAHDGYLNKYNSIHERQIEFYPEKMTFIGIDKIIKKKINHNYKFDIRFHLKPNAKLMKTQDNKTILIELKDEGWKFTCDNYDINIDNGLYFGNKNLYTENQNIFITGISNNKIEDIKWELKKI